MTYRAFILLSTVGLFSGHAFATSMGAPVHCILPKEAIKECIAGKAELRLVIGADGKLVSSSVLSAEPSPIFDKWAQCLADKIDVKIMPGTVKRLGTGTHVVPINFDPGECVGTRPNNSFKPNPHQGGA